MTPEPNEEDHERVCLAMERKILEDFEKVVNLMPKVEGLEYWDLIKSNGL